MKKIEKDLDAEKVLTDFSKNMLENTKELPADIRKIIDENFWDLLLK